MSESVLKPQPPVTQSVCARLLSSTLLAGTALIGVVGWTASGALPPAATTHWTADNGNGTYSNPLFYEEFEDPDITRVGEDYYLAGTTMHMNPAVQIMHSRDPVNWELFGYCIDRLDLGPAFRLEGGNIYARGIWAPCLRYQKGTFYIFSNVNGIREWLPHHSALWKLLGMKAIGEIAGGRCALILVLGGMVLLSIGSSPPLNESKETHPRTPAQCCRQQQELTG